MDPPTLLSVPNVSEGRDESTIAVVGRAFAGADSQSQTDADHEGGTRGVRLLDIHSDGDHHRSVFTLAGDPASLADALLAGARACVERIDVMSRAGHDLSRAGQHPHVGAVDVVPIVYLEQRARGAACAEALLVADRIASELGMPVFLYGELTGTDPGSGRTRAELRRGGALGLTERMAGGDDSAGAQAPAGPRLQPDFGPTRMHPTAGATLVAARPPLVAFNLQLAAPATLADAQRIAALLREGGSQGLPGLRAIGVALAGDVPQVSMNIERPLEVPLAMVVEAVAGHAAIADAELVGLAPRAAFEGFPQDVHIRGFDPACHVIENALGS
jgi:glutamate formiminotransferase / 5-formyltetrahydrofolate cyclo-ligase